MVLEGQFFDGILRGEVEVVGGQRLSQMGVQAGGHDGGI